jgi:hypothetical protein
MAYASSVTASPVIRMPSVAMPKLRWPCPSPRIRALAMIALMISPCFLADSIGYGVQRLFLTAEQIAAKQVPDNMMLAQLRTFHVACPDPAMTSSERGRWAAFAANHRWPRYPEAGPGCVNPDRNLFGIVGLKGFSVACPTSVLSVADHRRWVAFAANHDWAPFPQAGLDCVDP